MYSFFWGGGGGLRKCIVCTLMKMLTFMDGPLVLMYFPFLYQLTCSSNIFYKVVWVNLLYLLILFYTRESTWSSMSLQNMLNLY